MSQPVIVPHPNTIRGPIESQYNALRDAIDAAYVSDRLALEDAYHSDIESNQRAKEAALLAVGLNADGGTPSNYPESSDPENTDVPTITGTTTVGQELTADEGTWTFSPTFAYQWERADTDGSNNAAIGSATAATYTLVAADEGKKVRVVVTGTNAVGSHVARSEYTATIAGA